MERDKSFNFKLLVPPRVNTGQGYSKCFDKEQNMTFPNTGLVAPTKPTRQDFLKMKAVSPMEKDENNCNPGQLYSKLFDEVEKIKCWKVKLDSDTVQKERQLQENKRTIETQRKAIQELQFGNESLSIKLEERISENEDLRNKNSATRNLCNILKDTFERLAEKMHLFESEREETHHLFLENTENIQKLITSFESLRVQVVADQQEMQKVKEGLLHFEELKEKYHQECNIKEEEIAGLQTTLKDKENKLQKVLFDLHETQKNFKQLQEATNQKNELLKSSKTEKESLLQKLQTAELRCKESEKSLEATSAALEQKKVEYAEIIQSRDVSLQELIRVKSQQAEKLEQIDATVGELQISLSLKIQRVKELEDIFRENNNKLERTKTILGEIMEQSAKKDEQIISLKGELDKTSKSFESMKSDIKMCDVRVLELTAELSRQTEEAKKFKNEAEMAFAENGLLKSACEAAEKAHEDLKGIFTVTEIKVQQLEEKLLFETRKNKEYTFQLKQLRNDITQQKIQYDKLLSNFNELQSEKVEIQQQLDSGSSYVKTIETNIKVSEEKTVKLTREIQRLEEENQSLQEETNSLKTKLQGKCQETENKIEEHYKHMQKEITEKEKQLKVMETKLCSLRKKIETKLKSQEEYQKENKMLKKQITKETAKSSQLESVIHGLHDESQNLKRQNEEDHQKLLKDLESKSAFTAELENEVQKLRLTAAEAIKNKEDAEFKCQHKIADMVALMEKHKGQYDRMVEEKDAELQENKKKEIEAVAHRKSLELDLSKHKTEYDHLKTQLKKETTEKENLQKEVTDLKKELSSMKITQLSEAKNKQSHGPTYERGRHLETQKEYSSKRHVFDFSKTRKALSYSKDDGSAAVLKKAESDTESIRTSCGTTPKTKDIYNEDLETPRCIASRIGGSSKIKSYRIRTPPSAEKATCWGRSTIELDPKSDSSDQNDLLVSNAFMVPLSYVYVLCFIFYTEPSEQLI
ncbi:synaptonemal complex protein 1 isoform X1 [Anabas testudineus]|uniref:synaptonemal complex protein 1 isoform X1 n=1 Tax=Anabas testudineus TaxID=64144 RepID=UPI000E462691|nr:synaptonemal complex protein 1 isoform X1 [Anabas testudineus]